MKNVSVPLHVTSALHAPHASHLALTPVPVSVFLGKPLGHATSPACATHLLGPPQTTPVQLSGAWQIRPSVCLIVSSFGLPSEVHDGVAAGGLTWMCVWSAMLFWSTVHVGAEALSVAPNWLHVGETLLSNGRTICPLLQSTTPTLQSHAHATLSPMSETTSVEVVPPGHEPLRSAW